MSHIVASRFSDEDILYMYEAIYELIAQIQNIYGNDLASQTAKEVEEIMDDVTRRVTIGSRLKS